MGAGRTSIECRGGRPREYGWRGLAALAIGVVVASTQLACHTLEYYASFYDEEPLVALFPGNGASTVPDETIPWVELSWSLGLTPPIEATLREHGGPTFELDCSAERSDDMLVQCAPTEELEWETRYTFTASWEGQDEELSSTFYTGHPLGLEYEVGTELKVSQLGANALAATAFNTALSGGSEEVPLLLVAVDLYTSGDLPAADSHWVWGPGKIDTDVEYERYEIRRSVGYPFALPTTVLEDGLLFGLTPYAYLPLALDHRWHHVRIDDVEIEGIVDPDTQLLPVSEMRVEGNLTVASALRLTSHLDGPDATLLRSLIDLDTDSDGDGTLDSARLVMETAAVPATIHQD